MKQKTNRIFVPTEWGNVKNEYSCIPHLNEDHITVKLHTLPTECQVWTLMFSSQGRMSPKARLHYQSDSWE